MSFVRQRNDDDGLSIVYGYFNLQLNRSAAKAKLSIRETIKEGGRR